MKKICTLIIACLLITISSYAQTGKYVSAGTSYATKQLTYGVEAGLYGEKAWYGVVAETTKDYQGTNYSTYIGPKIYYKLAKLDKVVDLYTYAAVKVGVFKGTPLQLEPGIATLFNLNSKLAIQWNISMPIYENTPQVNPSTGLGLNFYF